MERKCVRPGCHHAMANVEVGVAAIQRDVSDVHYAAELRCHVDGMAVRVGDLKCESAGKPLLRCYLQAIVRRVETILNGGNRVKSGERPSCRERSGSWHRLIDVGITLELRSFRADISNCQRKRVRQLLLNRSIPLLGVRSPRVYISCAQSSLNRALRWSIKPLLEVVCIHDVELVVRERRNDEL